MNEQTKELIKEYAKANKIGVEKLERFVDYILSMQPQPEPIIEYVQQPVKEPVTEKVHGKTTDESLRIREQIIAMQESLKGKLFTSKELAQQLDADPAYVSNNLRWLGDNKGLVKIVGRKDREQGGRGRKENIWAIAQ